MTLYFDGSVVVPLLVEQQQSKAAEALANQVEPIVVSGIVTGEVASAISRLVRMNEMAEADGNEALIGLDAWARRHARMLECQDLDIRLAGTFVRQFALALRLPDAIHLALAHRFGSTLVTFDVRLAAAGKAIGIPVEVPA